MRGGVNTGAMESAATRLLPKDDKRVVVSDDDAISDHFSVRIDNFAGLPSAVFQSVEVAAASERLQLELYPRGLSAEKAEGYIMQHVLGLQRYQAGDQNCLHIHHSEPPR